MPSRCRLLPTGAIARVGGNLGLDQGVGGVTRFHQEQRFSHTMDRLLERLQPDDAQAA